MCVCVFIFVESPWMFGNSKILLLSSSFLLVSIVESFEESITKQINNIDFSECEQKLNFLQFFWKTESFFF